MYKRWWIPLVALFAICVTVGHAEAYDRRVRLINDSSRTIVSFYASNEDSDQWEEDILGRRVVPPGDEILINVDDGTGHCIFDFKAVMRGGATVVRRSLNVCQISSWTITD